MTARLMDGGCYLRLYDTGGERERYYMKTKGYVPQMPVNHHVFQVKVCEFGRKEVLILEEPNERGLTVEKTCKILKGLIPVPIYEGI